jgi:hypothetical protein
VACLARYCARENERGEWSGGLNLIRAGAPSARACALENHSDTEKVAVRMDDWVYMACVLFEGTSEARLMGVDYFREAVHTCRRRTCLIVSSARRESTQHAASRSPSGLEFELKFHQSKKPPSWFVPQFHITPYERSVRA